MPAWKDWNCLEYSLFSVAWGHTSQSRRIQESFPIRIMSKVSKPHWDLLWGVARMWWHHWISGGGIGESVTYPKYLSLQQRSKGTLGVAGQWQPQRAICICPHFPWNSTCRTRVNWRNSCLSCHSQSSFKTCVNEYHTTAPTEELIQEVRQEKED